jgi:hypothetical protein
MNIGWSCPSCGKIHAPSVLTCDCIITEIPWRNARYGIPYRYDAYDRSTPWWEGVIVHG